MPHRNNMHLIGAAFVMLFVLCGTMEASNEIIEKYDQFEKNTNGIVRDMKTGLHWYAGPHKTTT